MVEVVLVLEMGRQKPEDERLLQLVVMPLGDHLALVHLSLVLQLEVHLDDHQGVVLFWQSPHP